MPQVSREYSRIPTEHRPGSVISPSQGESQMQSENHSTCRLRLPTKSAHRHVWLLSLPLVVAVLSSRTSEVQQIHRLPACGQHPSLHPLCVLSLSLLSLGGGSCSKGSPDASSRAPQTLHSSCRSGMGGGICCSFLTLSSTGFPKKQTPFFYVLVAYLGSGPGNFGG